MAFGHSVPQRRGGEEFSLEEPVALRPKPFFTSEEIETLFNGVLVSMLEPADVPP